MITEPAVGSSAALDELRRLAVVEHLGNAGAVLDRLWLEGAAMETDEAMRLAEASQSVHRALVALTPS